MPDKTHVSGYPGPWYVEGEDEGDAESYEIFHSPKYRAAVLCDDAVIADIRLSDYTSERTPAEADGIARLIAAAPALFAVCAELFDCVTWVGPAPWTPMRGISDELLQRLRDAVLAARPPSPNTQESGQ